MYTSQDLPISIGGNRKRDLNQKVNDRTQGSQILAVIEKGLWTKRLTTGLKDHKSEQEIRSRNLNKKFEQEIRLTNLNQERGQGDGEDKDPEQRQNQDKIKTKRKCKTKIKIQMNITIQITAKIRSRSNKNS